MNRGLLLKAWRELRLWTLLLAAGLLFAESVLVYAGSLLEEQLSTVLHIPMVFTIIRGLLGTEMASQVGPEMLRAIVWVHPVILTLFWTHAIASCTRIPAGEVDRGTIDVLLGLPVSRWEIYMSETLAWLAGSLVIVGAVVAGNRIGELLSYAGSVTEGRRILIVAANMWCLYVAVAGLTCLLSAVANRRGRAIAVVIGLLLASFLLNHVVQMWPAARRFSFLAVLQYYQPAFILHDPVWPVRNMAILLGAGVFFWLAGAVVFLRRDLATL